MKLVSVAEMKQIESWANAHGYSNEMMMLKAGNELAKEVHKRYYHAEGGNTVVGLVGSGNNGGDTLVALSALCTLGWTASAVLFKARPEEDALVHSLLDNGGQVLDFESRGAERQIRSTIESSAVILDGVLGTGVRLPLTGETADRLQEIKNQLKTQVVVAVDCPSGVDCDTGETSPQTLDAALTVCMDSVKQGLVKLPAFLSCGDIITVDLGIPKSARLELPEKRQAADDAMAANLLPRRARDAHKGSFGTLIVVGGSVNYIGAPLLAARAGYRSGAGLVQLAIPASIQPQISSALLEAIWLLLDEQNGAIAETAAELVESKLEKSDALVLGPGLGRDVTTARFVERLLLGKKEIRGKAMGFVPGEPEPDSAPTALPKFVIDADGLQLLAEIPDWSKRLRGSGVLTPHPGEMAALTGMTAGEVQADREALALRFAREWNQVVVLKGALSVIAEPGGRSVIIPVATSALAKAGSGDVLSGVIGGLMAQGAAPFEAAVAGAWYHAQAGLQAAKRLGSERSVLAGDVIEALASVMA